ncbi:abscisic acid responsive element-binding factor1 [Striga asiatica]|uniref:Abscisic acid responsive element-binding factor1 n=1 Tax=Striga asiatica TaxID=4170 RepID=A0A5A7QS52_STRAF|nr:abscisic acid responsive element-binding factor1 [Striga asiatica]
MPQIIQAFSTVLRVVQNVYLLPEAPSNPYSEVNSLGSGDDGEPVHAIGIRNLGDHKEPRHNKQIPSLDSRLKYPLTVHAHNLYPSTPPHNVSHLKSRVTREARRAHGPTIQPNEVCPKPDFPNQRQILGVQHHHLAPTLDVDIERSLLAVKGHAFVVILLGLGEFGIRAELYDAVARLAGDEGFGSGLVDIPGPADEFEAFGAGEEEVGEGAAVMGLGGVSEEEDDEFWVGIVEVPGDHTEWEGYGVSLFDGENFFFLFREDNSGHPAAWKKKYGWGNMSSRKNAIGFKWIKLINLVLSGMHENISNLSRIGVSRGSKAVLLKGELSSADVAFTEHRQLVGAPGVVRAAISAVDLLRQLWCQVELHRLYFISLKQTETKNNPIKNAND